MKILITGISGYFGKRLSNKIRTDMDTSVEVIGLDVREQETARKDVRFLSGDTRKKRIEDIFKTEGKIDAVIHLARDASPNINSDESMMTNVYGTFHMLELSQKYNVEKFIFPSSSLVYGARKDNPALINENHPLLGNRDLPAIRDRIEADLMCQTFAQSSTLPRILILRIASIWRAAGAGTLSNYMTGNFVPTILGFDPMFQIILDEEVLESFMCALRNKDACGIYNIRGHIFMPLSRVIRHLEKTPLALPEFLVNRRSRFLWKQSLNFDLNYLKYPFAVDGTKAKEELGYCYDN